MVDLAGGRPTSQMAVRSSSTESENTPLKVSGCSSPHLQTALIDAKLPHGHAQRPWGAGAYQKAAGGPYLRMKVVQQEGAQEHPPSGAWRPQAEMPWDSPQHVLACGAG